MKKTKKQMSAKELAEFELVQAVRKDFFARQAERKPYEAQWELNLNFYVGNQQCTVNGNQEIMPLQAKYFWQEHQVFNHIAPIVERRLSKLARIRPKMNVVPASNDEKDLKTAAVSKKIINSVYSTEDMNKIICEVTRWSEICGTGFYKVMWNSFKGDVIGNLNGASPIKSGDVEIIAVSPFEIFPENPHQPTLENQRSIIHAKAYHIDEIKNRWGVDIEGESASIYSISQTTNTHHFGAKTTNKDYALVIEKYEAPSVKYPNGRMILVAGDKLVHVGELPYQNGHGHGRTFPFIKQDSIVQAGCFWGLSVVNRVIPLQIAYNAIKNRKHEFINRLSMGVLTIEDGSVDVDALEEEGLCPGKVLVYRQGANKPDYMNNERIPYNFNQEELALIDEFATVGGVYDFNNENYLTKGLSGTALGIMIEQDESKMLMTNDSVKAAIKLVAKHILRLYKQFVKIPKLRKIVGDNGRMEMFYFSASDIASDDVIFETKDEYSDSFAQRKEMIFALIEKGILNDEGDKMSNRMKMKVLDILGYGIWENGNDLKEKHTSRATEENYKFITREDVKVSEIDDHEIHIAEHTSFMLSGEFANLCGANPSLEETVLAHIRAHKKMI
ncbi:MAG: hypothetical protein IJ975_02825 [Clostridia bacterium]|nr:hypothetical protein [Clostridia bacterium]